MFSKLLSKFIIWNNNVRNLKSCQVESLAWCSTCNCNILKFFLNIGKSRMLVARINEVAVNFITYNCHIIFHANITKFFQFPFFPNSSNRIVWATQNEKFYVIFLNFPFKVLKIYFVMTVNVFKGIVYNYSVVILYCFFKRIIYRLLNYYAVALISKSFNCHCYTKNYAGCLY